MSICFRTTLLTLLVLFSAQFLFAQQGWSINRAKGVGDLISVFFTSSKEGWIAGDKGFLAYTKDSGRSWERRILNTAADINEIYFRNDNNGYLVAGRKMFVTKDGGRSWRETLIVNPDEFKGGVPEFLSIRFNSRKRGFIVGTVIDKYDDDNVIGSLVLKTIDGGKNWSRIIVPTKVELFHLDFDGKSKGWIVGDAGTVLATTDSGNTWTLQESGTDETLYNVDFRDANEGYAVGTSGTILRTDNGGRKWFAVKTDFTKTLFRVDFADDKNGWIVGSNGAILRSSDKGKSWVLQKSNTELNLYGLYMTKKYGWSVGKSGVIVKYNK